MLMTLHAAPEPVPATVQPVLGVAGVLAVRPAARAAFPFVTVPAAVLQAGVPLLIAICWSGASSLGVR
jgi:hypothetical protein